MNEITSDPAGRRRGFRQFVKSAFRERTVLLLVALFAGAAAVILWQFSKIQATQLRASALRDAARYSDVVSEFRTLYSSEVVSVARHQGLKVSHDYQHRDDAIPLPATLSMELGNRIAGQETGGETKLYSGFPFPWRRETGGLRDAFAEDAWTALNRQPDTPFWRIEEVDGRSSLRYATADVMRSSCVQCHNSHPESPKSNWKTGDVRGVIEVITPLDQAIAEAQSGGREFVLVFVGLLVPGVVAVGLVLTRLNRASREQTELNRVLIQENEQRLATESRMKLLNESLHQRADDLQRSRASALNMMRDAEHSEKLQRKQAQALVATNAELEKQIADRQRAESEREELHNQLVEASRQAGMAEVATGVLHNVGNVLNSVNVSAALVIDRLNSSQVDLLSRALDQINSSHGGDLLAFLSDDARGRHLPRLLDQVVGHLQDERRCQLEELGSLMENIEHIKEIISVQQSFGCRGGATERLNPVELVNDAIRINESGLTREGVEVVREFGDVPNIMTERHKVLQILINLISNAKNAVRDSDAVAGTVTVGVRADDENLCIEVTDNGMGIPRENLTQIFNHGFTTRKDGHGFGLHSSALSAQQLGGSLSAHSEGRGHGARFTLEIPIDAISEEEKEATTCPN